MKIFLKTCAFITLLIAYSCNSSEEATEIQQLNCLSQGLQNGVIAYYPFVNGSLNDESGNNYNLVNSTSAIPGEDRNGNTNCAFQFDLSNDEFLQYINPTFLENFHNSPFTISLWFKPTGLNWYYEVLIGRTYASGCQTNNIYGPWAVLLFDCRRANFEIDGFSIWDDYYNTNGCATTVGDLSNTWQHLLVTYDEVNSLKLYRNGILTTEPQREWNVTCSETGIPGDLVIGKNYTGLLDDIILYDRVLTSSEITELYNLNSCCN